MLDLHAPSDGSCNFLLAHTHLCTSQDLKSLQAGSRYLRFVPLMVLFRFYYSEYLTHLCSPRLYPALRYSFPFLSPLVLSPPPSQWATATVSNCFLSCFFSPLPSFSCVRPFLSPGPFSYGRQMIGIDEHRAAFRGLTPGTKERKEKERKQSRRSFCKNLFFNETQKGNKIKINNFFLLYMRKYLSHISKE